MSDSDAPRFQVGDKVRDDLAFAIWRSYWPDQTEQWIREHWETNTVVSGDRPQRVPRGLADVALEHLTATGWLYLDDEDVKALESFVSPVADPCSWLEAVERVRSIIARAKRAPAKTETKNDG